MTPILTSKQSHNAEMLRDILSLYAKPGDRILDMTYGEGKFWTGIDTSQYDLVTNDLFKPNPSGHHWDFRRIELPEHSFDMAILDPPYVHGLGNKTMHADTNHRYGLPNAKKRHGHRTNWGYIPATLNAKTITNMYKGGMAEAWRKLKPKGILALKTQDEIESGKQVWRHFDLRFFSGFKLIDLFVVTQMGKPLMRHKHQKHARKNHSYFMVYGKVD
jgi:tRNA G10  N-methylase Trm11